MDPLDRIRTILDAQGFDCLGLKMESSTEQTGGIHSGRCTIDNIPVYVASFHTASQRKEWAERMTNFGLVPIVGENEALNYDSTTPRLRS